VVGVEEHRTGAVMAVDVEGRAREGCEVDVTATEVRILNVAVDGSSFTLGCPRCSTRTHMVLLGKSLTFEHIAEQVGSFVAWHNGGDEVYEQVLASVLPFPQTGAA